MHVVSHPEADQELEAAALWYEQRQLSLGDDFLNDFERTPRRILAAPTRWHPSHGDNRKLNFDRFPYAIVYRVVQIGFTWLLSCTCIAGRFTGRIDNGA